MTGKLAVVLSSQNVVVFATGGSKQQNQTEIHAHFDIMNACGFIILTIRTPDFVLLLAVKI